MILKDHIYVATIKSWHEILTLLMKIKLIGLRQSTIV